MKTLLGILHSLKDRQILSKVKKNLTKLARLMYVN